MKRKKKKEKRERYEGQGIQEHQKCERDHVIILLEWKRRKVHISPKKALPWR